MNRYLQTMLNGVACALTMALALSATAAEKGDVKMPDTIEVAGQKLDLNGMGIREATIFAIDVYVAGLYVPKKSSDPQTLMTSDVPKKLVLSFVRDIDADDITDAFTESFEKNKFGPAVQKQLARLNGWMTDMKDGQSMSFTYVPGEGLTVEVLGKTKGVIEGKDFQARFLSIWLGENPPNRGLKKGLLGK